MGYSFKQYTRSSPKTDGWKKQVRSERIVAEIATKTVPRSSRACLMRHSRGRQDVASVRLAIVDTRVPLSPEEVISDAFWSRNSAPVIAVHVREVSQSRHRPGHLRRRSGRCRC